MQYRKNTVFAKFMIIVEIGNLLDDSQALLLRSQIDLCFIRNIL